MLQLFEAFALCDLKDRSLIMGGGGAVGEKFPRLQVVSNFGDGD